MTATSRTGAAPPGRWAGSAAARSSTSIPPVARLLGMPVTVSDVPQRQLTFQFDQPFNNPAGRQVTATVTSSLNFYAIDHGYRHHRGSGTNDNVKTQIPSSSCRPFRPGSYDVHIQLVSGPAPGKIEFVRTPAMPSYLVINQTSGLQAAAASTIPTSVRPRNGCQHDRRGRNSLVGHTTRPRRSDASE